MGGVHVVLREAGDGTFWATGGDGMCGVDRGRLFGPSVGASDRLGQVTPFLDVAGDRVAARRVVRGRRRLVTTIEWMA